MQQHNDPRDEIDAIVFGLAEKVGIYCEIFDRLSPPNFKHRYKWFPSSYEPDQHNYYQVEIKNGEIWIGTSGEHNRGFDLNNPNIEQAVANWLTVLNTAGALTGPLAQPRNPSEI